MGKGKKARCRLIDDYSQEPTLNSIWVEAPETKIWLAIEALTYLKSNTDTGIDPSHFDKIAAVLQSALIELEEK